MVCILFPYAIAEVNDQRLDCERQERLERRERTEWKRRRKRSQKKKRQEDGQMIYHLILHPLVEWYPRCSLHATPLLRVRLLRLVVLAEVGADVDVDASLRVWSQKQST